MKSSIWFAESIIVKTPFSADMEKRYKLTAVKIDKFHDDEIITFRNVAAKFLKGWGRAEIRSGQIIDFFQFEKSKLFWFIL